MRPKQSRTAMPARPSRLLTPAPDPLPAADPFAGERSASHLGRPSIVWSLSLLCAFKGLVALAVILFPLDSRQPNGVIAMSGAAVLVAAAAVWIFGPRFSMRAFEL